MDENILTSRYTVTFIALGRWTKNRNPHHQYDVPLDKAFQIAIIGRWFLGAFSNGFKDQ